MAKYKAIPMIGIDRVKLVMKTTGTEFVYNTSSEISSEAIVTEGELNELIVNKRLVASVKDEDMLNGSTITITENTFAPDIVQEMQGGVLNTDANGEFVSYEAPISGVDTPQAFDLYAYSKAVERGGYTGEVLEIKFPNCTSSTIFPSLSDGEFYSSELTITSLAKAGEPPYVITKILNENKPAINVYDQTSEYNSAT